MTITTTSIDLPVPSMGGRGLGTPFPPRVPPPPSEGDRQGQLRTLAAPAQAKSVLQTGASAFAGFDAGTSLVMIAGLLFVLHKLRQMYVAALHGEADQAA